MNTEKICGIPFYGLSLSADDLFINGPIKSRVCCPEWLKPPYNTFRMPVLENVSGFIDLDGIWNSEMMVTFRKSVADGSYSFCRTNICPNYLSDNLCSLPKRAQELISQGIYTMDYPPINIEANIDRACNLSCPSCRMVPFNTPDPRSYPRLKSLLASGVENIFINGTGELFRNQYLLKALNEITSELYPNLKNINIITNGTLLNKTMWLSLSEGFKSLIARVHVSVDAASEQTYRKIRVGGNFNRLLDNLKLISTLKKEKKIKSFTMAMVLQKANIHELLDFLKLAADMGADCVALVKVGYWYACSLQEFQDKMALPDNWEIIYKDILIEAKDFAASNNIYLLSNT